ncbi:MAG: DUF5930 domain-containing protein [Pseudomonadota bacterium]
MKKLPTGSGHSGRAGLLSEKRVFMKSAEGTRFVRLSARDQVLAWLGGFALVGWTVAATALVIVQFIDGNATREQAAEDRAVYETRVRALAAERDRRHMEALEAQNQFASLLDQLEDLQGRIFTAEITAAEKTAEAKTLADQLNRVSSERDAALAQVAALDTLDGAPKSAQGEDLDRATLAVLTDTLDALTQERAELETALTERETEIADLNFSIRLDQERNDRIFGRLEEAVAVSMAPLDELFARIGMDSDRLLETMRNRGGGQGGPLEPIAISTKGSADPDTARANNIITHMQELNLYRMGIESLPMALPVASHVRRTSGFGYRRDPIRGGTRLHAGVDWAGAYGTPIMATANGVVTFAGWQSGYGRMIKIQHEFGIETRYAHLSRIQVKVGQRVSRGDRIGAMGNSGRSTGTHLHYEVRLGGKATNPMTYITAARDVF